MDDIKNIKPGVGDGADLFTESPSHVPDNQTGQVYISREGLRCVSATEGYAPTHVKYTPKCYGEVNLPLNFRVAVETEIGPVIGHYPQTILETIFGNLGYKTTENFVVEQGKQDSKPENKFNDAFWEFDAGFLTTEDRAEIISDGDGEGDVCPNPICKNMGYSSYRFKDGQKIPHIRAICVQPTEDYAIASWDISSDISAPFPYINEPSKAFRITASMLARWENMRDGEGAVFRLKGRWADSSGHHYCSLYDRTTGKPFLAFGQRIGNCNYTIDEETGLGEWVGGNRPDSYWQPFIFTIDIQNLILLKYDPKVDENGKVTNLSTPYPTEDLEEFITLWKVRQNESPTIRLHITSINYIAAEDWFAGISPDYIAELFEVHGKIWLAEFNAFVTTNDPINRMWRLPYAIIGETSGMCDLDVDRTLYHWEDQESGFNFLGFKPLWNADESGNWNPVNIDNEIDRIKSKVKRAYDWMHFGHAPKTQSINMGHAYVESTTNCTLHFTDNGLKLNVIDSGPFSVSFWIRNLDPGKVAFDAGAACHIGRYSFAIKGLKSRKLSSWELPIVELCDVGTGVNIGATDEMRHMPSVMGRIMSHTIGVNPEPNQTFISATSHPGSGSRYVNVRVTFSGKAKKADAWVSLDWILLVEHSLNNDPTQKEESLIPYIDQLLPGKKDFWVRFYPYGMSKLTDIRGIDNEYHPICIGAYVRDGSVYADISNTYPEGDQPFRTLVNLDTNESYSIRAFSRVGYGSHKYIISPRKNPGTGLPDYANPLPITLTSKSFADRLVFGSEDYHIAVCNGPNCSTMGSYVPYRTHIKHLARIPDEIYAAIASGSFQVYPEIWNYDDYPLYIHSGDNRFSSFYGWTEDGIDATNPPKWFGTYNPHNWSLSKGY
ncbi:hypothetical protein GW916_15085, partial [bacterium]|nr:hypothetical protein [bacterium]